MSTEGGLPSWEIHAYPNLFTLASPVATLNGHSECKETPSASCSGWLGGGLFSTKPDRNRALGFYCSLALPTSHTQQNMIPSNKYATNETLISKEKLSGLEVNLPIHFWEFDFLKKHRMFSTLKSRPSLSPLYCRPGWPSLLLLLTAAARTGFCKPFSEGVRKAAP